MKFLNGGGGSVVFLERRFIYQDAEVIGNGETPGFESWESAEKGLEDIYGPEIPPSVKEAFEGLQAAVNFENSPKDDDIRSESFSAMTQLVNEMNAAGQPSEENYQKVQDFIEALRDFYEPIVMAKEKAVVVDEDREKFSDLADKILAENGLYGADHTTRLEFFENLGEVDPEDISKTVDWLRKEFNEHGFKDFEESYPSFKKYLQKFWEQLLDNSTDVFEDEDLKFLRDYLGISEPVEELPKPGTERETRLAEELKSGEKVLSSAYKERSVAPADADIVGKAPDVLLAELDKETADRFGDSAFGSFSPDQFA